MPAPVDHDEKRRDLARIAATLIAERGLQAATIREVAARVGFSTTVVTHYFSTKREMLFAAYRHTAEQAQERFNATARSLPGDPLARLESLLPVDEESRQAWRLYFQFWPMADHDAEMADAQRWWNRHAVTLAARALQEAYPEIGALDEKAALVLSGLHGIAVQALFDPDEWPAERQRRMLRTQTRLLLG